MLKPAEGDAARPPGGRTMWADIGGPVRYLDFGGPAGAPVIVAVHGLGGSAVNWSAIAPLLTGRCRLIAPDLAGHGLTRSAGRGTDVPSNRLLLDRFLRHITGPAGGLVAQPGPVILMGNSMGGMISLLEAAAVPGAVAGVILVDPALPFVPAWPDPAVAAQFALNALPGLRGLMARRRRDLSPDAAVAAVLALCCADPARIPAEVVAQHVAVARQRTAFAEADRDFAVAMRSVAAIIGHARGRTYRRSADTVRCPVLLLHGDRDRLVPVAVARAAARAHPSWSLAVLPGVGHVPQLEAPGETARRIIGWLGAGGQAAAESAVRSRPA